MISPSIFNAFNICPRQAWLMSRNLTADQEFSYLEIGRLISETTFPREKKEIYLADINAIIDMISRKNGDYFVCEIKKSSKTLETGILQLKYYLYLLKLKGLSLRGILKIPKERKSVEIELTNEDIVVIEKKLKMAKVVLDKKNPPEARRIRFCSKCGYKDFCWA